MPLRQRFHRFWDKISTKHDNASARSVSVQSQLPVVKQNDGQTDATSLSAKTANIPTSLPERLWDQAYDDLKIHDAALVEAYEKILSRKLSGQEFNSPVAESEENIIAQGDAYSRRKQMRNLITDGLDKTAEEAKIKSSIGTATEFIFSAKDIISSAVQAVPQAALAWTGVCIALEVMICY